MSEDPQADGADRRTFLRQALTVGVAAPVLGALGSTEDAARGATRSQPATGFTSLQQAGQRVVFSYPGLSVPSSLLNQITAGAAAGVIFFGENISSPSQIASVVAQLRQAQSQSPVPSPLLLMTDQEGGEVRRLPGEPTLSEKQIGASSNPSAAAAQAGTGAGHNLAGVGMNVNLAPVLDVFYTAGNFIDQYQRSYSSNAATVSACGQAFISAQQATGVAATAKHFPGLGSATRAQNTDLRSVRLSPSRTELRDKDESPYPAAIAAGVKLVMLSWAIYPALDRGRPAGLSSAIAETELRGRLGFAGVTVTDALEAGALDAFGDTGARAVSAARAGMDLILCSARDVTQGHAAAVGLANALDSGKLHQAQFSAALARVTALRNSLH